MNIQKEYKIRAKKSLGQNFLKDEKVLEEIVGAQTISGNVILEVGPGYGALSEKIIEKSPKAFTMIELDDNLAQVIENRIEREEWSNLCDNIQLVHTDVLKFFDVPTSSYSVIANIPYYITSPILHHFLYEVENLPDSMTIMMQKDVGDKILKQYHHKKPKSSVLSLFLAKKTVVKKVCDVAASSFEPAPKVASSVLYFEKQIQFPEVDDQKFLEFVKKAFLEPRKKLISNLVKGGYEKEKLENCFSDLNIELTHRPEDLHIKDYCQLLIALGI